MKRQFLIAPTVFPLLLGQWGCSHETIPHATRSAADDVLSNGRIYTVDDDNPWAQALAVRGNEIVYVGDDAGVEAIVGETTRIEDLGGEFVMPGMIATHEQSTFYMITSSDLDISELSRVGTSP